MKQHAIVILLILPIYGCLNPDIDVNAPESANEAEATPPENTVVPGHLVNFDPEDHQNELTLEEKIELLKDRYGEEALLPGDKLRVDDMVFDIKSMIVYESPQPDETARSDRPEIAFALSKAAKWPNGKLILKFSSSGEKYRSVVFSACNEWARVAKVSCVERTTQKVYLEVIENSDPAACFSAIGYQKGQIAISGSGNFCTLHELGHSFGVAHEQCRSDRDSYIQILWNNIIKGKEGNFGTISGNYIPWNPYDYFSQMHYYAWGFSNGNGPTIQPVASMAFLESFGQVQGVLSPGDIFGIASLYGGKFANPLDSFQTANSQYLNKKVNLKTLKNYFVVAEGGGGPAMVMNANRTAAGDWEKFTVVDAGGGWVAFKTFNGNYVTAHKDTGWMYADRTAIGDWEKFKIIDLKYGGHKTLMTFYGKLIYAANGGGSGIFAYYSSTTPYSRFLINLSVK